MEHELASLWRMVLWGFGICTTGFFLLTGWMWKVVGDLHSKVTYSELKNEFIAAIDKDIDKIVDTLNRIEAALVGDIKNPRGLITKVNDMKNSIDIIRDKCPKCEE